MPLDVSGWVETTFEDPASHGEFNLWEPLLYLGVFGLGGDDISDYLFGLAKEPSGRAVFPSRGIPSDCTRTLRRDFDDNARFVEVHGEGDFGHSYATWREIEVALARPDAPPLSDTGWTDVLSLLRQFATTPVSWGRPLSHLRVIVWANW